jgi:hypothetical protein
MTRMSRTLFAPLALFALMLFAVPALATETGTTGYYNTPPKPAPSTSTTTPTPASGTGPSRETSKPRTTSSSPSSASSKPSSTSSPTIPTATHSTLPFTGLDLRWVIGIGLLLIGAGVSMRLTQRRQRQGLGR